MSKLKSSKISKILEYLEYGEFCLEDFNAKFPEGSTNLAELVFKAMPKYSFILCEDYPVGSISYLLASTGKSGEKKVIQTIEKPGEYKTSQVIEHDHIDDAIMRVAVWVANIREDLTDSKIKVQVTTDELTDDFQSRIDESIKDQESYFEPHEEEELKAKLDELQARVSELESWVKIDPEDTKEIQNVIDKGKENLKVYPKGVWYKTVGTKLIKTMKEILKSKEGKEVLADIAKKLLQ